MDLLRVLSSPDLEVRKKTLSLILDLINSRNVEEVGSVCVSICGRVRGTDVYVCRCVCARVCVCACVHVREKKGDGRMSCSAYPPLLWRVAPVSI